MLQLLDETNINCLVVDWATGEDADTAQQAALQPLIEAGRRKGISFVGAVTTRECLPQIAAAGKTAGLEALLLSGPGAENLSLPVIAAYARDSVDWDNVTETFVLTGNVWPEAVVRAYSQPEELDAVSAGPSRAPWVQSNGWVSQVARGVAPSKALWLDVSVPDTNETLPAEKYCLTVADARAHGCRWIIDLDEAMRTALAEHDASAIESWKKIAQMDAFFDSRSQWCAAKPVGVLTVVSDFRGSNSAMSCEVLSMLKREQIPFTLADRKQSLEPALAEKQPILWLDNAVPSEEQSGQLLAFVELGGLVIAPNYWGPKGVAPHRVHSMIYYDFYSIGKGRIVVASAGFSDPFVVAKDAYSIVGREHDPVRLFDSGTTTCFATVDTEKQVERMQIMNYIAPRPAVYVSLWIKGSASTGRLTSPDSSSFLTSYAEGDGTTFDLPPVAVYCAVEIARKT